MAAATIASIEWSDEVIDKVASRHHLTVDEVEEEGGLMGRYSQHLDPGGEPVELSPARKRRSTVLSLRLPSSEFDDLADEATRRGAPVGALAREYIRAGLRSDQERGAPRSRIAWQTGFVGASRRAMVLAAGTLRRVEHGKGHPGATVVFERERGGAA